MGGRRGYGPTHSQSIEAFFLGIPNLDVFALNIRVAPEAIYQPLMDPSRPPALVIENKVLYTRTLRTEPISGYLIEVSDEAFPTVRIRPKDVRPEVTIVCYGGMLELVEDAIGMLFSEHEIVCEVISPTRLIPLNMNPIVDSVSQTGRVLIAEEGKTFAAWGSEVLAELCRDGCRMQRVARLGNNQLIPSNFEAENQRLAGTADIIKAINGMMYD
jgi:2-oxoisovalerate dehydrogenase E1 component